MFGEQMSSLLSGIVYTAADGTPVYLRLSARQILSLH